MTLGYSKVSIAISMTQGLKKKKKKSLSVLRLILHRNLCCQFKDIFVNAFPIHSILVSTWCCLTNVVCSNFCSLYIKVRN